MFPANLMGNRFWNRIFDEAKIFLVILSVAALRFAWGQVASEAAALAWESHDVGDWLELCGKYKYTTKPWGTQKELEDAIRHFGVSAVPFLLQRIKTEQPESALEATGGDKRQSFQALGAVAAFRLLGTNADEALAALVEIARTPEDRHFEYRDPAWGLDYYSSRNRRAIFALGNIGAAATPALLELAANGSSDCRADAIYLLGEFGTNAAPAIPVLIEALAECTNHVAVNAARTLGRLKQKPEVVVPALTNALKERVDLLETTNIDLLNPRLILQYQIFQALVSYGPMARPGVPAIIAWLDSDHSLVPQNAADALGKLRILPELAVPALTKSLDSPNPYLVRSAANALAAFGPDAKPAVPKLLHVAGRTNLMLPTHHAVVESLRTITTAIPKTD